MAAESVNANVDNAILRTSHEYLGYVVRCLQIRLLLTITIQDFHRRYTVVTASIAGITTLSLPRDT